MPPSPTSQKRTTTAQSQTLSARSVDSQAKAPPTKRGSPREPERQDEEPRTKVGVQEPTTPTDTSPSLLPLSSSSSDDVAVSGPMLGSGWW